jgi:hypothetical protein
MVRFVLGVVAVLLFVSVSSAAESAPVCKDGVCSVPVLPMIQSPSNTPVVAQYVTAATPMCGGPAPQASTPHSHSTGSCKHVGPIRRFLHRVFHCRRCR